MVRERNRRAPRLPLAAALALGVLLGLAPPGPAGVPSARAARLEVAGPAGAALEIDGRALGPLPLAGPLELEPGIYDLACRLQGHQPFRHELLFGASDEVIRLQIRLTPLSRKDALLYGSVLAGLGQHYVGRPRLGWALTVAELGGLATAVVGETSLRSRRDDYLVMYDAYGHALDEDDIAARKLAADEAYGKMKDAQALRDTGLIVAAGAVVVGLLDLLLRFPAVAAGPGELPRVARGAAVPVFSRSDPPGGSVASGGEPFGTAGGGAAAAVHVGWSMAF